VDATVGVTDQVEKMHHTIQLAHPPLGTSRAGQTSGLTGFVYRRIRGTTRLIGQGLDAGMNSVTALMPRSGAGTESLPGRDAVISAINGVCGDHLARTDNPLAVKMSLYFQGLSFDIDKPDATAGPGWKTAFTGKILLFVHGLCLNESHWNRNGIAHGERLAERLGYTPVFLRYNTGLPVSDNGKALAGMLEELQRVWPQPVSDLVIVGHSMGGLVARSASYHGKLLSHDWLRRLRSLVFMGTPHHGAPLERGGNWLDRAMDLSPYAAPFTRFGRMRSAGITDLRHGNVSDEAQTLVPLPEDIECYAVAATLAARRGPLHEHLIGDGLVPVNSALGRGKAPLPPLLIPDEHQWVGFNMGHLELLGNARVYEQLYSWLN
jgi:pimeloyl-ACP methyl ester carboxylesterase